jgi:prevent-host-death family protein
MTTVMNVYEAKTQLSRLLDQVEQGEEVILARAGRPIARLVRYRAGHVPRRLGQLAGRIHDRSGMSDHDLETDRLLAAPGEGPGSAS